MTRGDDPPTHALEEQARRLKRDINDRDDRIEQLEAELEAHDEHTGHR